MLEWPIGRTLEYIGRTLEDVGRALEDVGRTLEDVGRALEDGTTIELEDELSGLLLDEALLKN